MSEEYSELLARNTELIDGLSLNSYDEEHIDEFQILISAYIVMFHAELENYFETVAKNTVYKAFNDFKNNEIISTKLLAVSSSGLYTYPSYDSFGGKDNDIIFSVKKRIGQILSQFTQICNSNHGIREKHLVKLLMPLGLSKDDITDQFIQNIESLSMKRGKIAHVGRTGSKELFDFNSIKNEIENILNLLEVIDEKITN